MPFAWAAEEGASAQKNRNSRSRIILTELLRMATSLGGLKTSTAFEVYDKDENVIPGLYACGEVVGGVHGDESMPSCMVGWAVTSGRLTGFSVAEAVAE